MPEYKSIIRRVGKSRFLSLDPDPRVPFKPIHLVPNELKLENEDYSLDPSEADLLENGKFKNETPYKDYLDLNYLQRPRQLLGGYYSYSVPEIRKDYKYVTSYPQTLARFGIDLQQDAHFTKIVSGQKLVPGMVPYSAAYAGWQFGQFAGQLGDGRVSNLFELQDEYGDAFEFQLKGSGKGAFSRFADGKATVKASLREFLVSEFLNSIKIPTTRCISLTMLPKTYAQRRGAEQCAVVCRYAPSWVRVGNFDLQWYRQDVAGAQKLADYCIGIMGLKEKDYRGFLRTVVELNASTIAKCQVYGFLNGVLNTDNTSILGLCIDFGPFAIMDEFDPTYTPNSEDPENRYGYSNAPNAIWWNMVRLAESLGPLLAESTEELIQFVDTVKEVYQDKYLSQYVETFGDRLGVTLTTKDDESFIKPMLEMLRGSGLNYNEFFVALQAAPVSAATSLLDVASTIVPESLKPDTKTRNEVLENVSTFLEKFRAKLSESGVEDSVRQERAVKYNPLFYPSNWAFDELYEDLRENGFKDFEKLTKFMHMVSYPFDSGKWGSEAKDFETKILGKSEKSRLTMQQCSCSS